MELGGAAFLLCSPVIMGIDFAGMVRAPQKVEGYAKLRLGTLMPAQGLFLNNNLVESIQELSNNNMLDIHSIKPGLRIVCFFQ